MGSTTGSIIITVKGKEVYVGTAPPSSPVDNELWLDISENNVLKYYKASTKTWCVVNDVSEKFGDVYKYLQTNYYTKTETNSAVKEEIEKTTIIKKDGTVVNMKDAINSVIDTATEHTQKIEDINSKYNSVTGEITEVKTSTSEIKQDLNGFKTTVSENYVDKTEFNNLQIGGTNLLKPSIDGNRCEKNTGYYDIKLPCADNSDTYVFLYYYKKLEVGETYTLSCNASGVKEGTEWSFGLFSQISNDQLLINKNGKTSITFVMTNDYNSSGHYINGKILVDDSNCKWGAEQQGNPIILSEFKLEKGNKATDWSPAPEDTEEQITSVKTSIEQTDKYIEANVVKNDEVVTKINASQEGVSIKADKISLEGYTTINDNFKIDEKGNMEAKNGKFSGEINATSGEIAGLTIKDNSLYHRWYDGVQNGASVTHFYFDDMGISSLFKEGSKKLWIGAHPKIYSAEYVDSDGKVMDENMEYPFYVTDEGYLLSKTGNIAGYDFNSDGFYSPFTTNSRKTQRFAIKSNAKYTEPGTPFIGLQDENEAFKWFYVKTDGSGYFTNLEVSEDIQSTGNVIADGDIIAGVGTSNQVSVQGLSNNKVNKSDIVNNLSTSSTDKPLSAYQGKVLSSSINSANSKINAIQGKCFLAINETLSSNRTSHKVTIKSTSVNLPAGNYIAIASAVIQTTKYTSDIRLGVDGKDIGMGVTNSTTPMRVSVMGHFEITSSKKTNILLNAFGHDSKSSVTVTAYESYSIIVFKIG